MVVPVGPTCDEYAQKVILKYDFFLHLICCSGFQISEAVYALVNQAACDTEKCYYFQSVISLNRLYYLFCVVP